MLKTRQHDAAAWIHVSSVIDGFDESVRDSEQKKDILCASWWHHHGVSACQLHVTKYKVDNGHSCQTEQLRQWGSGISEFEQHFENPTVQQIESQMCFFCVLMKLYTSKVPQGLKHSLTLIFVTRFVSSFVSKSCFALCPRQCFPHHFKNLSETSECHQLIAEPLWRHEYAEVERVST